MNNGNKVIQPIEFVECPIEFVEKPIEFIAFQKDENGELHEIILDNALLAGCVLPAGISMESLEQMCKKNMEVVDKANAVSDIKQNTGMPAKVATEIVKSRIEVNDLTNYELLPLCKYVFLNRDGKVDYSRNEILVKIRIEENCKVVNSEFSIKCVDIDKITSIIGKKFPTAIIYNKKDSKKVENDFREKTSSISNILCYTDAGWQKIDNNYVFVHRDCIMQNAKVMTSLNLPCYRDYKRRDIVNVWHRAINIYNNYEVAAALGIYSFLGVSYKLFDEAGLPPHFLLFLNGKTGSLKTSIAKILYTQLSDEQHRDFPRRIDADTQTSFERAIVISGQDTITLIDDYSPAKTLQKKKELDNSLEAIIRMVGDGSTKSRSNINLEDCRGEGVKGMVVLTGELKGKGLSSNLRCLYCEVEKEKVNLEVMTWFQNNRYAFTTLIQHFIYFLSAEWINIVAFIKDQIEPNRRGAEKHLKERRLVDTLTILWIMSDIVGWFLAKYCDMNEREVQSDITLIKNDLPAVVVRSEFLSNEENPAQVFMKAVISMIEGGKLHLASKRLLPVELQTWDGYEDETFVYLLPNIVYQKVTSWLKAGGVYFGVDINQLAGMLSSEGYTVSTSNGANKKLNYARIDIGEGRKVKFFKIYKSIIDKLQDTVN